MDFSPLNIIQPAGIGDILVLQKALSILRINNPTYLKVAPYLQWMVNYLPVNLEDDPKGIRLVTDASHFIFGGQYNIMESKYKVLNLDMTGYINYIDIKRNTEKEQELFTKLVKSKYRLICNYIGTPQNSQNLGMVKLDIPESTELQNIYLQPIEGYTLFDWLKIIQLADEIYTTDGAPLFLIERYYNDVKKVTVYSRFKNDFEYRNVFNRKYNIIYGK